MVGGATYTGGFDGVDVVEFLSLDDGKPQSCSEETSFGGIILAGAVGTTLGKWVPPHRCSSLCTYMNMN